MRAKNRPALFAFLLLHVSLSLPTSGMTPHPHPGSWSRSLRSQPTRSWRTPAWAGRPFTAQIGMTGTFRHGFPRPSITFAGVGVNWSLDREDQL